MNTNLIDISEDENVYDIDAYIDEEIIDIEAPNEEIIDIVDDDSKELNSHGLEITCTLLIDKLMQTRTEHLTVAVTVWEECLSFLHVQHKRFKHMRWEVSNTILNHRLIRMLYIFGLERRD